MARKKTDTIDTAPLMAALFERGIRQTDNRIATKDASITGDVTDEAIAEAADKLAAELRGFGVADITATETDGVTRFDVVFG